MSTYKVGSLYAGVGGICQGFIDSGFKIEWANEFDKNACETYRQNFHHNLIEGDVWDLDPLNLPSVDVLVAGFPCQPFSIAGYRKGFEDDRGNHFFKILQFLKLQNPKVVVLENVKNLTSHDKGNTFKVIRESLTYHGYKIYHKVLNTKDYTNIPQNRERIFVVGFKDDSTNGRMGRFSFPDEIPLTSTIHDFIEEDKVGDEFYYTKEWYRYDILEKEITSPDTLYQWRRHYVRENKSNVCPTLTANMGTGGHNVPLVLTEYGIRKLTPRECFNFQGFSKNFKLPTIANSQLYKQSGNSVTVPLVRRVTENILKTLEGKDLVKQKELMFQKG